MSMSIGIDWKLLKRLHLRTSQFVERAQQSEKAGCDAAALSNWSKGLRLAKTAAEILRYSDRQPQRSNAFLAAATCAFKCEKYGECENFIESGLQGLREIVDRPGDPLFAKAMEFQKLSRALFLAGLKDGVAARHAVRPTGGEDGEEAAKCA